MSLDVPLVSIVIPAYNHDIYLSSAIESVLCQDYENIELIVINDGSTDSTAEVLNEYGDKFYWKTQENIGQANTLNNGWSIARGDILSYLSADDVLEKDAVSASIEVLKNNKSIVMTYCDFNLIDEDSKIIKVSRRAEYSFHEMVVNIYCIPGPGVFFKRSAFEKAGPWNSKYRQMPDYDFWIRLGITGDFLRIPKVLANFRVHKESQTFAIPPVDKAEEPNEILESFFKRNDVPLEIQKYKNNALSNANTFSAQLHFKAGRYKNAFYHLCKAIKLYPINMVNYKTYKMILHGILSRPVYLLTWSIRKVFKPAY